MTHKPFAFLCAGLLAAGPLVAQQPSVSAGLVRQLNDAFAGVYEKIAPTVVVIEVRRSTEAPVNGLPEGLEFFFRRPPGDRQAPVVPDQGSGFIISADGHILTNNHVVDNAAAGGILVKLKDGRKFPAKLIGTDPKSDIAVIKIEATDLPVAEMGDSDAVRVGNFAFAIGAPESLPYTFTVGVISAKGRNDLTPTPNYEEYIQTDASINPGNSGGPLCDIDGRVVGVNTLISGMNRGLGFAVPINLARKVGDQLIAQGRVSRPWLGIGIKGIEESVALQNYFSTLEKGVVVEQIDANTPAFSSELREGDVILKVDNVPVALSRDLQREILGKTVGADVQLEVWRGGQTMTVTVKTGEQPDRLQRADNRSRRPQTPARPQANEVFPGLSLEEFPPGTEAKGVVVNGITQGSAAAASGLQPGDIITEAGGKPVRSKADLQSVLGQADLKRGVMVFVERNGQRTFAILKP
jgi:Do/DeqQ family serine protease